MFWLDPVCIVTFLMSLPTWKRRPMLELEN